MKKGIRISLIIFLVLGKTSALLAETFIWLGAVSSDWADEANWLLGDIPGSNDDVLIPSEFFEPTANFPIIDNLIVEVRDVAITQLARLEISSDSGLGELHCNALYVGENALLTNSGKIKINPLIS